MSRARLAFAALLAVAPTARASAADMQVHYTVDYKALKAAVSGTVLTFAVYSDSGCTTLVDGSTRAIDDVDLIERVKRFTPKGGVKPPATARLVEVLDGLSSPLTVYLQVTGTGIVPVGGACQLQHISADTQGAVLPCATQVGNDVFFTACNVHVRNGLGGTYALNGLGNLVVGYNGTGFGSPDRSGSHNLVVGDGHTYSGGGGFVAGQYNAVTGVAGSVAGGALNVASGSWSTVSGGHTNEASGDHASISGGQYNDATDNSAAVAGGARNLASGGGAFVGGGFENEARGVGTSILGGQCNVAGAGPKKFGCFPGEEDSMASVTGGFQNLASGNHACVTGGNDNQATGGSSVVSSGNGTIQPNGFGWSAGAFGALTTGRFASP